MASTRRRSPSKPATAGSVTSRGSRKAILAGVYFAVAVAVWGSGAGMPLTVMGQESTPQRSLTDDKQEPVVERQPTREELESKVKALTESLAAANAEADFFKESYQDIRRRIAAVGLDIMTGEEENLQKRLLKAVQELYVTEQKRREGVKLIKDILYSGQTMLKTAKGINPADREDYEVKVRQAHEYLAGRGSGEIPVAGSLQDGRVLDVNKEHDSVIINLGSKQGVKNGMPFRVLRQNQAIARLRILAVDETKSVGMIETGGQTMDLKVGDTVVVAAEK